MTVKVAVRTDIWDDADLPTSVEGVYASLEDAIKAAGNVPGFVTEVSGKRVWWHSHRYGTIRVEEFTILPSQASQAL